MRRRALLTTAGAALTAAVSGCVEGGGEPPGRTDSGSPSTDGPTPTATDERTADTPEEQPTETPTEEETPTETAAETPDPDAESGRGDWSDDWAVKPASWTAATPPELDCENDDATRVKQGFDEADLVWGNGDAWEMRTSDTDVGHGDTIRVRLMNVTDETRSRQANSKYNVQVETESGWQDVRTYESREQWGPHPAVVRSHESGESYEWQLTLDEDEIAGDVCPPLQDGRYRFVYYGFEEEGDRPVGVGFNLST